MKGKIGKEEENAKLFSQLVASQEALKDAVRAARNVLLACGRSGRGLYT